jgi:hypothetical protein
MLLAADYLYTYQTLFLEFSVISKIHKMHHIRTLVQRRPKLAKCVKAATCMYTIFYVALVTSAGSWPQQMKPDSSEMIVYLVAGLS